MIATVDEIKSILGITDAAYDARIGVFMPLVQDDIIEITNNDFASKFLNHTSASTYFEETDSKIKNASDVFTSEPDLSDSKNIVVSYSLKNSKHFTITSVGDNEIVVDEAVIDESNDDGYNVTIRTVIFPEGLKATYANLIWFKINNTGVNAVNSGNISSKKLNDFSVSYDTEKYYKGYLKSDLEALNKYKKSYG